MALGFLPPGSEVLWLQGGALPQFHPKWLCPRRWNCWPSLDVCKRWIRSKTKSSLLQKPNSNSHFSSISNPINFLYPFAVPHGLRPRHSRRSVYISIPLAWLQLFPVQTPFGSRVARAFRNKIWSRKPFFLFRRSKRSQVQIQSCCICGKAQRFCSPLSWLWEDRLDLSARICFKFGSKSRSSIWGGACKLVWKILVTRELVKVLVVAQLSDNMSFRSIVRDVRESFGSLSRRGFEVRISGLPGLSGHHRGKSVGALSELHNAPVMVDQSGWAGLPPELLRDVMKRLEEGESTWPSRKDVVACAAACKAWREICKDIVQSPEFCGKLTFPLSLKQPGPRDGLIQCFIKRDKSTLTYHLYLCLSPAVLSENGKFLLAAKRNRRTTYTEYIISVDSKNISRSSNGYVGKMRSNFLGTKFVVYDTQPPYNAGSLASCQRASRRISSRRVSPKVPTGSYPVAQVNYELNLLGTRGPRRMQCTMHSIPASALEPEGVVPGQPKQLLPGPFEESFRSTNASSRFSITDFSSSRFSEISEVVRQDEDGEAKERPLVLCNKVPRWHEQLQCWCLNFRGRVTVASVKNFQLTAAPQPAAVSSESSQPPQQQQQQQAQPSSSSSSSSDHEKVILQFGKVTKDMFTMDYRYPLSAFQAFAICLTSFDTKLACE